MCVKTAVSRSGHFYGYEVSKQSLIDAFGPLLEGRGMVPARGGGDRHVLFRVKGGIGRLCIVPYTNRVMRAHFNHYSSYYNPSKAALKTLGFDPIRDYGRFDLIHERDNYLEFSFLPDQLDLAVSWLASFILLQESGSPRRVFEALADDLKIQRPNASINPNTDLMTSHYLWTAPAWAAHT
jgi:hypothetical protein